MLQYSNLYGLSVMSEYEEVSVAPSALLPQLKKIPTVRYYDNSCNMSHSIAILTSWENESCMVFWDGFLYKGNIHNSLWNIVSYPPCSNYVTSGVEPLKYNRNFSKLHVRHIRADNMVDFLEYQTVWIDLITRVGRSVKEGDKNVNIREFVRSM